MPKGKGGALPGAGRKKIERPPEVQDKQFAARVLAKIGTKDWLSLLKAVEDYELYLSRVINNETGKPLPVPPDPKSLFKSDEDFALWFLAQSDRGLANRTFITFIEKRDGKAMHTVNHLHDKPIEMNVNVSMAELVREVRQRKEDYERTRK